MFQEALNSISFATFNWDLIIFIVFFVGLFFYVFRLGRDRVFILLMSNYIALAFVGQLDIINKATGLDLTLFLDRSVVFILLLFILFWIISRSPLTSVFDQGPSGSWVPTLAMGFLQLGLMVTIFVMLSSVDVSSLSLFIRYFFVDDIAKFFWFIAPWFSIVIIK